jgi:uncharacterized protein Yka (UPF0111/DUF47 family)
MAKRGRPRKTLSLLVDSLKKDEKKVDTTTEKEALKEIKEIYESLNKLRTSIEKSTEILSQVEDCENLTDVVFKAGRTYHELQIANSLLEEVLDGIYDKHDFDHYYDL